MMPVLLQFVNIFGAKIGIITQAQLCWSGHFRVSDG